MLLGAAGCCWATEVSRPVNLVPQQLSTHLGISSLSLVEEAQQAALRHLLLPSTGTWQAMPQMRTTVRAIVQGGARLLFVGVHRSRMRPAWATLACRLCSGV